MATSTTKIVIKQGEAKNITITVKDSAGTVVDLSAATLTLGVKANRTDTVYSISKADSSFTKTSAASGIVVVKLTATDTNLSEGDYIADLKCSWTGGVTVNKTLDFIIQIKTAITS